MRSWSRRATASQPSTMRCRSSSAIDGPAARTGSKRAANSSTMAPGDGGVLDQHLVDVGGRERGADLAAVAAVGPQHGHVVPGQLGPQHEPVQGVDLGPAVPHGQRGVGQPRRRRALDVERAAARIGDAEVVQVGPPVVHAEAQGVGQVLHRPQPEALDDGQEAGQLHRRPRLKTFSRAARPPWASGVSTTGDVPTGEEASSSRTSSTARPAGDGVAVGGREPVGPRVGQAGAPALAHPVDEGLGQVFVPGPAQQPHLPLERVAAAARAGGRRPVRRGGR